MNILIIGPYAPHGQVGAIRMISLSRYLVNCGHKVTVLCLSDNSLLQLDPSALTARVPENVSVYTYDISLDINSNLKRNILNEKECCYALKNVLMKKKFDVAIISGGPFYQFKTFKLLKKYNIPYIVDYRDLNISSKTRHKFNKTTDRIKFLLSYPARFLLEYNCIKNAQIVTVVAPEMRKNISGFFHIGKEKIEIIFNGYDDDVLANLNIQEKDNNIFTIGYFGKLMYYDSNLTIKLFNTIEKMNKNKLRIRLVHIGPNNSFINEYLNNHNMNKTQWYECTGQKDYKDGMRLLAHCDVCALEYIYPEGPGTKVFDYIYLNKPIIGILKPGISLEKMLKTFDNAYVCYDEDDIEGAINKIMTNHISRLINSKDSNNIIAQYSRSVQNKKFEQLLISISKI